MKTEQEIVKLIEMQEEFDKFSGIISIVKNKELIFEKCFGYANRSEKIANQWNTRFGMASGCKIFTAVAIAQLVEKGRLTFESLLKDILAIPFPNFSPEITVHHLLTHNSGIPDYFDEEVMDDFAELWEERPVYSIKGAKDFLPMFQNSQMQFKPGERFKYNNAGFIVLGLIVEAVTGMSFTDYVEENIFGPAEMTDSGYFAMNQLPERTALGYIYDDEADSWSTNIFAVPIKGGSDGGAFTTVSDMSNFWSALFENQLLSKDIRERLLTPHIEVENDFFYGYGVWMKKNNNDIFKYFVTGEDPGVNLMSSVYPTGNIKLTVIGNTQFGTWDINRVLQNEVVSELV